MKCNFLRDNKGEIVGALTPQGKKSELFDSLMNEFGSEKASELYAVAYSDDFLDVRGTGKQATIEEINNNLPVVLNKEIEFLLHNEKLKINLQDITIEEEGNVDLTSKDKWNTFGIKAKGKKLGYIQVRYKDDNTVKVGLSALYEGKEDVKKSIIHKILNLINNLFKTKKVETSDKKINVNAGKGIGKLAYELLAVKLKLDYQKDLISDTTRSDYAENLWKSFEKQGKASIIGKTDAEYTWEYYYKFNIGNEIISQQQTEPTKEELLYFVTTQNREQAKLSTQQKVDLQNLIQSTPNFNKDKFVSMFYDESGLFSLSREKLEKSGIYTPYEIQKILSDVTIQQNLKQAVEGLANEEEITYVQVEDKYKREQATITSFGKVTRLNPYIIENTLMQELGGLSREDFNKKVDELPYKIADKEQLFKEVQQYAQAEVMTEVDGELVSVKEDDFEQLLYQTAKISDDVNFIESLNTSNITKEYEESVLDNLGIDITGLSDKLFDAQFVTSLYEFAKSPNKQNTKDLVENYNRVFEKSAQNKIIKIKQNNSLTGHVLIENTQKTEEELFEQNNLIKTGEKTYIKVEKKPLEQLYQDIATHFPNIKDLKTYIQQRIKGFKNAENAEAVELYKMFFNVDKPLLLEQLSKTELADNIYRLPQKELEDKLNELGINPTIAKQVVAFHGSPYSFDRFTTEKMGTGEGAQAFGWGLYFTDLESIARNYAEKLANPLNIIKNVNSDILKNNRPSGLGWKSNKYLVKLDEILLANDAISEDAFTFLGETRSRLLPILKKEKKALEKLKNEDAQYTVRRLDEIIDKVEKALDSIKKGRNLYKVSLHKGKTPEQYTWLEWDRPVKESFTTVDYTVSDSILSKYKKEIEVVEKYTSGYSAYLISDNVTLNNYNTILEQLIDSNNTPFSLIEEDFGVTKTNLEDFLKTLDEDLSRLDEKVVRSRGVDDSKLTKIINSLPSNSRNSINISNGELFYKSLSNELGSQKEASLFLLENGIDGVKYPAESISRGATSDTARGFNYVVFDENAITIEEQIQFQKVSLLINGFIYNNDVYLNKDTKSEDVFIHEFQHLYNNWLKQNRPNVYNKGLDLIQQELINPNSQIQDVISFVKNNQPNLTGESLKEEILTELVGRKGLEKINQKGGIFSWIREAWQELKNLLGLSNFSDSQILKMNLDEFTQATINDLLKGEVIRTRKQQDPTKFFQKMIKERNKNSEAWKNYYSNFEINSNGVVLKNNDPLTQSIINLYENQEQEEPQTQEVVNLKSPYEKINETEIIVKNSQDKNIRVNNIVYELTQQQGNLSLYKEKSAEKTNTNINDYIPLSESPTEIKLKKYDTENIQGFEC